MAPPIVGCICILVAYVFSGAAVIAEAQSWAYCDALYFCFVSLLTIGFGGIQTRGTSHEWTLGVYLLLGVTVLSTCFHILQNEVTSSLKTYRQVKRRNRILLTDLEANNKIIEQNS